MHLPIYSFIHKFIYPLFTHLFTQAEYALADRELTERLARERAEEEAERKANLKAKQTKERLEVEAVRLRADREALERSEAEEQVGRQVYYYCPTTITTVLRSWWRIVSHPELPTL